MFALRGIIRKFGPRRITFAVLTVFLFLVIFRKPLKPNVSDMLDLKTCPACYGVSLCSDILKGPMEIKISFDYWGRFGLLLNLITSKNVYSGLLHHKRVIVKRLGHDSELRLLDTSICDKMGTKKDCKNKMNGIASKISDLRDSIMKLLNESTDTNLYRLRLCPSVEHADNLFQPILPKVNGSTHGKLQNDGISANIWTLLQINPEPLLLQIMRAEDGWPVPFYLGACGRISVTLYAGEPISEYLYKTWPERAGLALQLLLAADRFTFSHPRFSFYLLDVSSDNIVVNEEGKLSFVDLEHVVAVDRHPIHVPNPWNESHITEQFEDCIGCTIFSTDELCKHHTSDHNHFMICQQLLAPGIASSDNALPGGLLHSIPPEINKHYPQMIGYIQECSSGSGIDHTRSARRLRDIINIASKESPLFGDRTLLQTWKYF